MNLMELGIRERRPRRVLEFGSGLSTACLARYMAENAPDSQRPAVVSAEENADFCASALILVAGLGLDAFASLHHAPLARKDVGAAVLHTVLPRLPDGFRFYLDDGLSDSALEYARLWAEIPGVKVAGVALVGHGVLVGDYRLRSKTQS
jgi:hypothetical protein